MTTPKSKSIHEILQKKYDFFPFEGAWFEAFGSPEKNFKALIWGLSGHGKTTFTMKFCKYLSQFGKVYYNSVEEGEGKSIQDVAIRCQMEEVAKGMFMMGNRDDLDTMRQKLKRNRARFVVIDSSQYLNLTMEQYKKLIAEFKTKSFIIISWQGNADMPKGEHAKAIMYRADIKIHVKEGKAHIRSRFGGSKKPFEIMPWKGNMSPQLALNFSHN